MPTAVAVVPVIETSTVMQQSGFVAVTVANTQAFINNLIPGDALGVASFDVQSNLAFAPGGNLAVVDSALSVLIQADNAVQALTFTGAAVNVAAGLQAAYALFPGAPSGAQQGAVLISSGQFTGTNPATLSSYVPTWVCAPGPAANTAVLQQIAAISHGTYYYMPTSDDMMTILNQIRGQFSGWTTVLNATKSVGTLGSLLVPVTLAANLSQVQFSVVWNDTSFAWTSSSLPAANQVSVTLVRPPGITLQTAPTSYGSGFAVWNLTNPVSAPGPWYVQVMYPGTTAPLGMTIGVFTLPKSTTPRLVLEPRGTPKLGAPLDIDITVHGTGEPYEIVSATAEVVEPNDTAADGHARRAVPLVPNASGELAVRATSALGPGTLNVKVHVRATTSSAHWERTELLSVPAPEPE